MTRKNGKEMTMDSRLDYLGGPLAMKFVKHIKDALSASRFIGHKREIGPE